MTITISEQFVEAKTDARLCEDLVVVTNDYAAVIDGASDATGALFDGKAGGRFAAKAIAASIGSLAATATGREFADTLTSALSSAVAEAHGALSGATRWPAATVACVSAHRREFWRIGDCHGVIGGVPYPGGKRVDDAAYGFRAAMNAALAETGVALSELIETDPGYVASRALIDIQQHLSNKVGTWGFGCVNGTPIPDEYVEVVSLPPPPTEVILATDGYPVVHPTLRESEVALAEMTSRDPASINELWPMGKPSRPGANAPDDRTYLRIIVD